MPRPRRWSAPTAATCRPDHGGDTCSSDGHLLERPGVTVETAASFVDVKACCRRLLAKHGVWDTAAIETLAETGGVLGPIGTTVITVSPADVASPGLAAEVGYRVEQMRDAAWPSAEQIAAANATANAAATARTAFDRTWSSFDLSDCKHPLSIGTEVAGWFVDVCVRCGRATPGVCTHPAGMEWNDEGTLLRCRTCGRDGT